ncbi:hypothetical protein AKJ09_03383 [Labilithrix luteola]|uniref:Thiol:disulfide interchange protein DsbD N-terminal domain-containing protein n=1 Tax=Labilithrix luteola TaxID=1391654 RepID=A0A0K1PUD3_9BACT|nr:hypothetical protein AKJ09_03383 [Labilithrix luteola]
MRSTSIVALTGCLATLAMFAVTACEKKSAEPKVEGAAPPSSANAEAVDAALPASSARVEIPEVLVRAGAATSVQVAWNAPAGTTLNDDAPFRVRWTRSEGLTEAPPDMKATGGAVKDGMKFSVTPTNATAATLVGEVDLVVCDVETHAVCLPVHRSLELDFFPEKTAAAEVRVSVPLPAAKTR